MSFSLICFGFLMLVIILGIVKPWQETQERRPIAQPYYSGVEFPPVSLSPWECSGGTWLSSPVPVLSWAAPKLSGAHVSGDSPLGSLGAELVQTPLTLLSPLFSLGAWSC